MLDPPTDCPGIAVLLQFSGEGPDNSSEPEVGCGALGGRFAEPIVGGQLATGSFQDAPGDLAVRLCLLATGPAQEPKGLDGVGDQARHFTGHIGEGPVDLGGWWRDQLAAKPVGGIDHPQASDEWLHGAPLGLQ